MTFWAETIKNLQKKQKQKSKNNPNQPHTGAHDHSTRPEEQAKSCNKIQKLTKSAPQGARGVLIDCFYLFLNISLCSIFIYFDLFWIYFNYFSNIFLLFFASYFYLFLFTFNLRLSIFNVFFNLFLIYVYWCFIYFHSMF